MWYHCLVKVIVPVALVNDDLLTLSTSTTYFANYNTFQHYHNYHK